MQESKKEESLPRSQALRAFAPPRVTSVAVEAYVVAK
jgi:hypothetical protein